MMQSDIAPGALGEMLDQLNVLADPLKHEKAAAELWQQDWAEQDKSEWNAPQKPAHDGPAPTASEVLEQKDDVMRFYEQRQTNGDRARLFGFNAATGESLTWEWDAQTQQAHIEDPQNVLDSLKQLDHWEGMETMLNEKASTLSGVSPEQAGSHASQITARRNLAASKDNGIG